MRKNNFNKFKVQKERKHKINGEVRFPQVRLIGQGEPVVISSYEASKLAESLEKDLILISDKQDIPIVRIEDYNKFIYDQEKLEKERKRNLVQIETKEIQLSCEIADNDLLTKSRKAEEFLKDGNKVKCVILLKGRQKSMPERGELVMLKFAEMLSEFGSLEAMPKLDGSRWIMTIKSKKK